MDMIKLIKLKYDSNHFNCSWRDGLDAKISMSNKYGIPEEALSKIRARDTACIYCHKEMREYAGVRGTPGDKATIEHLNNKPPWDNPNTVAICCGSCNASRGNKMLVDWFKTPYCMERNINEETVAEPVKEYVRYIEKFLGSMVWTFAKTMPDTPHDYVVRDALSDADKKTFDAFGEYIKRAGYSAAFASKRYNYLHIRDFKYWMIGNILNRAEVS